MTARQVWEGMLTELSKVNAPSMLLQDFNYFFNKAINQYINKRYNVYDMYLQSTDDLRVLKATSILDVTKATNKSPMDALVNFGAGKSKLLDATYEVNLPSDYMHILNCVCIYKVNKNWKCYDKGNYVQFPATRLTADNWSSILNDYYRRPLPERPYYYIHNVNINDMIPTDPYLAEDSITYKISIPNVASFISNGGNNYGLSYHVKRKERVPEYDEFGNKKTDESGNIIYKEVIVDKNTTRVISGDTDVYRYSTAANLTDAEVKSKCNVEEEASVKSDGSGTDMNGSYAVSVKQEEYEAGDAASAESPQVNQLMTTGTTGNSNFARTIKLSSGGTADVVERETAVRYGNASKVRMEIRYGHDSSIFTLVKVFVDYIKTPQFIRLTQEQVNLTEDTSQIMEFPDYVCQEIINELTTLVMENSADPRLLTHIPITQSIANPAQQLPQQPLQLG